MVWKRSTNTGDAGSAPEFGGADINKIVDFIDGVNVSDSGDFVNDMKFRTNTIKIRNPGNTFSYIMTTSAIVADRTITWPLLTGNDTLVFESHTQTLANKTLTTPVISTIINTGTLTLPTATTTIVGRDTTDTLSNKTLSGVSILDATNIVLDTTTGTKIGTATGQKLAFFNKAPVDQRAGIADVATDTVDGTYGAEEQAVIESLRTKLNAVLQVLEDLGLTAVL